MDKVSRAIAGLPVIIAFAVAVGLLTLITHSSPHSDSRSGSVGTYLHGCTSTLESVPDLRAGPGENRLTDGNRFGPPAAGDISGSTVGHEPHPMPGACLVFLIAMAFGLLLALALRALPSRHWILPALPAFPAFWARAARPQPVPRLALSSRLLL